MKSSLIIAAVIATLVGAPLALSRTASTEKRPPSVFYGHIKSMSRHGNRYEIRFDPALWLTGRAAEQAKFEDTGSRDVPNDYYIVEEGHRLLTFAVAKDADVTVLVVGGADRARISVSELNAIVHGRNPQHRRLSQPKSGFWIRIGEKYPNPAVKLFQQYQP
jgi:hypothetical protein